MAEYSASIDTGADDSYEAALAASKRPNADPNVTKQLRAAEAQYWAKELAQFRKWAQRFHTNAKKIEDRYMLEAQQGSLTNDRGNPMSYNLFWSNVQTILAIVYGRDPTASVDRTNMDANDDAARVAGLMLERIFNLELKNEEQSPARVYNEASRDLFLGGLGIAWARYEFNSQEQTTAAITDELTGEELAPEVVTTIITDEFVPLDYVRWSDFAISPCRSWNESRWIGRRVRMTKSAVKKRFGEAAAKDLPTSGKQASKFQSMDDPSRFTGPTHDVWELWDKENLRVCWYVEGMQSSLESKDDPLKLGAFYPAKEPLRASNLPRSFLPKADYLYLRDQYNELDMLGARMSLLSEAIRVVGIYDKSNLAVQNLLGQAAFNQMIPVDNWAMFAEKGGIKGVVDWFPVDEVVNALERLTQRKAAVMQDIYEIYGINDVMRGNSAPGETATSQRLKTQFGSARLEIRQQAVAAWITHNLRLRAEIICRHWEADTIIRRSGIMQTPDAKHVQAAMQLLKGDPTEVITRLTVSADTISSPDWQLEQQQRVQYVQAVGQFISMVGPLAEKSPGAGQFLIQILQWAAAGFKGGKQIEGVLDQALEALAKDQATPKPPPPPTAEDEKDKAQAQANIAGAKKDTATAMKTMAEIGFPPMMAPQLPPQSPPGPGGGMPPGAPGMPPGGPPGPGGPPPPGGGVQQMPGMPNSAPQRIPGPGPMVGGQPV